MCSYNFQVFCALCCNSDIEIYTFLCCCCCCDDMESMGPGVKYSQTDYSYKKFTARTNYLCRIQIPNC